MHASISKLEQITPHLFAELSFMIRTPSPDRAVRASGVRKRFAPSTTIGLDGLPSTRKSRQFVSLIVAGRPPPGTNASAITRLCSVFRRRSPSGSSTPVTRPRPPSRERSKDAMGSPSRKSLSSSSWSRPSGSSPEPLPSATPTMRAFAP